MGKLFAKIILTGGFMNENLKTAIRNIILISLLDLLLLPTGIYLYLTHGFHLYHLLLVVGYIYGVKLVFETSRILMRHILFVSEPIASRIVIPSTQSRGVDYRSPSPFCCQNNYEGFSCDCDHSEEPIKPSFKRALDKVFGKKA